MGVLLKFWQENRMFFFNQSELSIYITDTGSGRAFM